MVSCTKVRFPSRAYAERALHSIRTRGARSEVKPIRSYACQYCNGWHLTHEAK